MKDAYNPVTVNLKLIYIKELREKRMRMFF